VLAYLAVSFGESCPRSLAARGPRCGSGEGLVGRLERRVRLLPCCHPLETVKGNAVGDSGDAEGRDPPVDPDGDGVTVGSAALGPMKLGGRAGERHGPMASSLGQRG
jgi:hypothetical protein